MAGNWLSIGQVAKRARVNIQTVRYYERRKLLFPDKRKDSLFGENGYRLYSEEAVKKLLFIKRAQELGFTLKEISGLLRLRVSKRARCENVRKNAQAKLVNVEEKIGRLKAIRRALKDLIYVCHSEKTTDHCPILKSLEVGKQ